jgi:NADPH-dependent 2,4-dienoyl-CoA reductase/sulfur reductase-like enzyme
MQQQALHKPFVRVSRQQCRKAATSLHSRSIAAAAASSDFQPLDAPSSFSTSSAASSSSSSGPADTRKKVVVVGGGWAGFGAAKHLAEQGYAVTLIEAAKNPGGLSGGFRTSSGKVVEAGERVAPIFLVFSPCQPSHSC